MTTLTTFTFWPLNIRSLMPPKSAKKWEVKGQKLEIKIPKMLLGLLQLRKASQKSQQGLNMMRLIISFDLSLMM